MNFLQPSGHHLPSLKFLRKRRLIATTIYVGVYYFLFIVFAVSIISVHTLQNGSYFSYQLFGIIFILFVIAGVGVLVHIRRLTLAFNTKRRALQTGTTMPQYDITISPVEASVLIDAVDEGEVSHLIVNSIQEKGGLRAWRSTDGRIQLQNLESGIDLTYYERTFMTWLFTSSTTVTLTDRQLQGHRAAKEALREIYRHMREQGYYAKMNHWQRFIYEYAVTTTIAMSYLCYLPLILGMSDYTISLLTRATFTVIPMTSLEQVILVLGWAAILCVTPIILLIFSTYSKKGSETFRNVYGLYWFLKVVYESRLTDKNFVSQYDYKKYAAYAKAFGLQIDE